MDEPSGARVDRRKVRAGLVVVGAVVVAALVLMVAIEGAFAKAVMFGVAAVALVRAYLLSRWLRTEGPGGRSDE